ncbi:uncharacterized protein LOC133906456 [Phragmites australis]|uniref:uncharacterized protein LOC133906456 n=1 Tax=Phragmites australis TaxID=29695 RepID=UPI002D79C844|nr:uncharacterized protein LOC133906456 [Phragmites australis]
MPANLPRVVLFLTAAGLLLAASASPVAGGGNHSGGRMVIIRAPGARVVAGARNDRATAASMWQRRLEDEVAPEFPTAAGGGMLGADGGHISYDALEKDKTGCQSGNQCTGKGGGSYTRPCTYNNECRP